MKQQPIGANCLIKWFGKDTKEVYISFCEYDENVPDPSGLNDDQIYYYSDGEKELQSLMEETDWKGFEIISYGLNYSQETIKTITTMISEELIRDAIQMLEVRLQDTYKRIESGYPNDKDKLAYTMAKIQALKWTLQEIPYLSL